MSSVEAVMVTGVQIPPFAAAVSMSAVVAAAIGAVRKVVRVLGRRGPADVGYPQGGELQ